MHEGSFELVAGPGCRTGTGPRRGRLRLPRGIEVETPLFLAVGTAATIKGVDPDTYLSLGGQGIICNTYHLFLRPGPDRVRALGGLHRFMAFPGVIFTDSGGFQGMSLGRLARLTDEGISFRSHWDGSAHLFTPESVLDVQRSLGSDVALPLDVCPPATASAGEQQAAAERTVSWARRSRAAFEPGEQLLFGIVQGGFDAGRRRWCAEEIGALDFDGYAIGGLSVGEARNLTLAMAEATLPHLPVDRPRYVMGMGRPAEIVALVARGVDVMDCVLPTRMGRNARAFTAGGELNLRNARFATQEEPLDSDCDCPTCTRFSTAYLHHLFRNREILGALLLTQHNLRFYLRLMERIRVAIEGDTFGELCGEFGVRQDL